jgi:hypothetical protein
MQWPKPVFETESFFPCLLPGDRLCLPRVGSVQRVLSNRRTQSLKQLTPHAQPFAMILRAGFTATLDGKKLPSTT